MSDDAVTARYSALHTLDSPANRLIRDTIWGREQDVGQQSFITPSYLDNFATRLQLGPEDHLLDIGSGTGGPAVHISTKTGCRVTGVDVNAVGVGVATELASAAGVSERVSFHLGDAIELPFPDEKFTAAISVNVMNVFPDKSQVLAEVRRTMKPGGRFALLSGTFDDMDDPTRIAMARGGRVPQHYDSSDGYRQLLADAGFSLDEVTEYVGDFRVQMARWRDAYVAHRPAVVAEEGEQQAADHVAYFEAYLGLIEAGAAANQLFLSSRPS